MLAVFVFNLNQTISIIVFSAMICGVLFFWRFRLAFAFIGITALIGFGLIDIPHIIEFAGLDIILFIMGTMIVVGFLEERHFFEYLVDKILSLVGSDGKMLITVMMLLSALFSALVGEVTSILFMMGIMLHLTYRYKLNPIPFVIMIVFATNIGSSATVVGNPVGVIIAMRAGLTFIDFIRWALPISLLALALTIPLSLLFFSKDVKSLNENMKSRKKDADESAGKLKVTSKRDLKICWLLFLGTVIFLILHSPIEGVLNLKKNSMLLGTVFAAAGIALLLDVKKAQDLVERRVDWWTLSFFIMLFASAGTLKFVGTTEVIGKGFISISGNNEVLLLLFLMGIASLLTGFIDNVIVVATFIPIIQDLHGVSIFPLWWGLLFAGTLFGNLTIIGSTANIVAIGMVERRGLGFITFMNWIKPGLLISISTLILAIFMIFIQLPLMAG
jgi:Na+/H+ antiporter NhaD/arsenite permease-like protein